MVVDFYADHYISQVHLKNFYSPKLDNLMYAIRKSDLKAFTPNSESVCRIENGSTNSYLRKDRIVEEFLKEIEPKYNASINKLKTNNIDSSCIYTIAGFVAYVVTCSPAGIRIGSSMLKGPVEETARILDSQKAFPPVPSVLVDTTTTELINSGALQVEINPKFPQAIGISQILSYTNSFGNSTWEILLNNFEDNPFFTSDFPVAIEKSDDNRIINKLVPLSPNLAIRIHPNISLEENQADNSFSKFKYSIHKLNRQEVIYINKLIVQCAEDLVFFRDNHEWVTKFVTKNAKYWIEPKTQRIPHHGGAFLWSTQEITERKY